MDILNYNTMQKRTYEEAVQLTVQWWVKKSFKTHLNQNNGDSSKNGIFSLALMNTLSMKAQNEISPEQIEKFEAKLTELLLEAEQKSIENPDIQRRHFNELDVDYHPNKILSEACRFAQISTHCSPVKTFTYIDEHSIINGRNGYGSDWFKF